MAVPQNGSITYIILHSIQDNIEKYVKAQTIF
jgi:hypothetical protein